jgi:hypothetical protein
MDVVWIPCSVGSSLAAVIIVVTWFQYNLNTSAALAVITVNGAELQLFRDALDRGLLHVEGIVHVLVFLQSVYYHLTFDIAKAAIEGENLGRNTDTDLLTISCSSTDYIGHQVGVNAIETEDCYLRLDKALADFFAYLDQTVGKGNYLTFLTADHGGVNNATFLQDQRIPAGIWNKKGLVDELNKSLKTKFNTDKDLVKTIMNYQVFFNTDIIEELGLDYAAIKQVVVDRLKKDKDVHYAFDMEKTSIESIPEELKFRAINGYNRERSGGVQIVLKPGHYDYYSSKGTTHGAWNPYDIHIPCLFMGWGIQHGESAQPHYMTDIAATVCAMLHIQAPNGCIGTPIF